MPIPNCPASSDSGQKHKLSRVFGFWAIGNFWKFLGNWNRAAEQGTFAKANVHIARINEAQPQGMRSKHKRTKSKMPMGHTKMFPSIFCAPFPNNSGRECLLHKIMRGGKVFSSTHTSAEWEEGAGNVLACFRLLCLCDTSSLEILVLRYWTLKNREKNVNRRHECLPVLSAILHGRG